MTRTRTSDRVLAARRYCSGAVVPLVTLQGVACAALRLSFKWTGQLNAAAAVAGTTKCNMAVMNAAEVDILKAHDWNLASHTTCFEALHALWPAVAADFAGQKRTADGLCRAEDALIVCVGGESRRVPRLDCPTSHPPRAICLRRSPVHGALYIL